MRENLWIFVLAGLGLFVLFTYMHMLRRRERLEQEAHARAAAKMKALTDGIIAGLRAERIARARRTGVYTGEGIVLPAGPQGPDGVREVPFKEDPP